MHDKARVEEHQEVIVQNQLENPNQLKIIEGDSRILLIAPHACIRNGEPKDDENTGPITEMVARQIGCSAIINTFFHKSDNKKYRKGHKPKDKEYPHGLEYGNLNLNLIADAKLVPGYLNAIRAVIDKPGKTTAIWIHGADDNKAKEIALKGDYAYMPNDIHAFIGYGQGNEPITKAVGSRHTAESGIVERFRDALIGNEMNAVLADDNSTNYRGRSEVGMNQWFLNGGYTLEKVQSFQIEIREKGFRKNDEQCQNTARIIADAISATLEIMPVVMEEAVPETLPVEQTASDNNATENTVPVEVPVSVQDNEEEIVQDIEDPLVEQTASDKNATEGIVPRDVPVVVKNKKAKKAPVDEKLVQNAFERLKDIFRRHFHEAMLEAGTYIIDTFYDGNPMAALAKNKTREQPQNLKALVQKISGAPSVTDDGAPSLGWFYNAVNLAAHEAICSQEGLQTFATLGHSHKLLLLHVPKLKQIEGDKFDEAIKPAFQVKERLAKVAVEKDLSVRKFAAHIKTEFPDENTGIDLTLLPPREILLQLSPDELRRLFNLAMNKVDESQKAVLTYGNALHELDIVLAETNEDVVPGKGRFKDWTKNNFNICTGCKNDCLYCYMKPFNAKKPKSKQPEDWHNWEIRLEDVDKAYGLKDGLVGFPSSHDIFPDILDAYLTVLGKLLRAGNKVLIVSKPRIDCIKPICEASHFFKDKIIFRFTIGAMDNDILGFWEPNAPVYEERRACLEFAYNHGFWTSVSMEPMLDTPRIEELIADLRQFVRKDENIWLGTMGYMNYLKQIKKGADDGLTAAIAKVEAGQTKERLTAIFQTYKDDQLIKWKAEALKIIEGKQQNGEAVKIFQAPAGIQDTVSIAAPETEILEASDAVAKANKSQAEKVNLKEKPEALPSKDVSPASNIDDIPQSNSNDESKTLNTWGSFEK